MVMYVYIYNYKAMHDTFLHLSLSGPYSYHNYEDFFKTGKTLLYTKPDNMFTNIDVFYKILEEFLNPWRGQQ